MYHTSVPGLREVVDLSAQRRPPQDTHLVPPLCPHRLSLWQPRLAESLRPSHPQFWLPGALLYPVLKSPEAGLAVGS